jgi:hypothetical protein
MMTPAATKKTLAILVALLMARKRPEGSGLSWGDFFQNLRNEGAEALRRTGDVFAPEYDEDRTYTDAEQESAATGSQIYGVFDDAAHYVSGR